MKLLFAFAAILSVCNASPIAIFGTGVDPNGQSLAPGSIDPHWSLVLVSAGASGATGSQTYVPTGANTAEQVEYGVPAGWPQSAWVKDSPAQWIAPQADVTAITDFDSGGIGVFYTYQENFSLSGMNPATAELSGAFAADNYLYSISLNGHTEIVNPLENASCGSGPYAFQSLAPFSLASGFVAGENAIDFTVVNSNCYDKQGATNPTGFVANIGGTAAATDVDAPSVPEPDSASLLIVAALLIGGGIAARRRRV